MVSEDLLFVQQSVMHYIRLSLAWRLEVPILPGFARFRGLMLLFLLYKYISAVKCQDKYALNVAITGSDISKLRTLDT